MTVCAVIDDGVSVSQYPFLDRLAGSVMVTEDGVVPAAPPEERTHGTLCAAVIRWYSPETEIFSVQALDPKTGSCDTRRIRKALEWCAEQSFTAINLSAAGLSFREWPLLRPTISLLLRKGVPLVCAWHNTEKFSLYTNFTWPISVEKSPEMEGGEFGFQNRSFLDADFLASSSHVFALGPKRSEAFTSQNSHAAPVVASAVCRLLEKGPVRPAALFRMLRPEERPVNPFHIRPLPDFLDRAVILGQSTWSEELWMFERDSRSPEEALAEKEPFFLAAFPGGEQELAQTIRQGGDALFGVFYAGIAPEEAREAADEAGCLFWDEQEYRAALGRVPEASGEPEGPLVAIRGEPEEAAALAKQLQQAFIREGYRCLAFSDFPQAYALGMIFLPEPGRQWLDVCKYAGVFEPDVMVYCGEELALPVDLEVVLGDGDAVFRTEEREERITEPGDGFYSMVCRWLEGEES